MYIGRGGARGWLKRKLPQLMGGHRQLGIGKNRFFLRRHVRNFVDRNVRRQIWRGIGRIGFSIDHAGPSAFLKDTPMHFLIYMLHGRVNRTH